MVAWIWNWDYKLQESNSVFTGFNVGLGLGIPYYYCTQIDTANPTIELCSKYIIA